MHFLSFCLVYLIGLLPVLLNLVIKTKMKNADSKVQDRKKKIGPLCITVIIICLKTAGEHSPEPPIYHIRLFFIENYHIRLYAFYLY